MKKILLAIAILTLTSSCWAAPSNTISVPNSHSPNTVIQSSLVNANDNEIQTKYNAHSHTDITSTSTITTGTWNATIITPQYGGTGQNFSSTATQGHALRLTGTGVFGTLPPATSGWAWITQGGGNSATWGHVNLTGTTGTLPLVSAYTPAPVQVVRTQTGAVSTGTTLMPYDDTIPQITEGDQYMTLAITPRNTNNLLKIDVVLFGANSSAGDDIGVALFQDSTANALASGHVRIPAADGVIGVKFTHYMAAGTAASTTFRVRAGARAAGTVTFNGFSGGRLHGGVLASSISITEYQQ